MKKLFFALVVIILLAGNFQSNLFSMQPPTDREINFAQQLLRERRNSRLDGIVNITILNETTNSININTGSRQIALAPNQETKIPLEFLKVFQRTDGIIRSPSITINGQLYVTSEIHLSPASEIHLSPALDKDNKIIPEQYQKDGLLRILLKNNNAATIIQDDVFVYFFEEPFIVNSKLILTDFSNENGGTRNTLKIEKGTKLP